MVCNKCGNEIPDDSVVCLYCGQKFENTSGIKRIQLKCKNCGGTLTVDTESQDVICPYCGAKEKILDSDLVAVEKIKKEVEFAKIANENEKEKNREKKEDRRQYRKSKLAKISVLFLFICLGTTIYSFKELHIFRGLIAMIQTGLFGASWLMGMQIVEEKRKNIYVAFAILGFLLIIPFMMLSGNETTNTMYEKISWPGSGISTNIPNPNAEYGNIITNDSERFHATIDKYSQDNFIDYKKKCEDMGYTIDSESSNDSLEAYNDDGYKLELHYYTDKMSISLDAPISKGVFTWPKSEIAKLLPVPKSNKGKIDWEGDHEFVIYVCETSIEDYNTYVEAVSNAGFNVEYHKSDTTYYADNKDGYHVNIDYKGNATMYIRIDEPDDGKKESDKEENIEKNDNDDNKNTADTSSGNDSKDTDDSIVDPNLKAFLDSYEEFIDEYIAFMEKYNDSSDTIGLLTEYTEMLNKYADFADKIDQYDTENMSKADSLYYIEVTSRCSEKLLKASIQ